MPATLPLLKVVEWQHTGLESVRSFWNELMASRESSRHSALASYNDTKQHMAHTNTVQSQIWQLLVLA